jgi:hypothetical protein
MPLERAKKYRELAEAARKDAAATRTPQVREHYLAIAGHWERLAVDMERLAGQGKN